MTDLAGDLGAWVAERREASGLSQQRLAEQVGLDQAALSRIESGQRRVSIEELVRLSVALDIDDDELLGLLAHIRSRLAPGGSIWERETG